MHRGPELFSQGIARMRISKPRFLSVGFDKKDGSFVGNLVFHHDWESKCMKKRPVPVGIEWVDQEFSKDGFVKGNGRGEFGDRKQGSSLPLVWVRSSCKSSVGHRSRMVCFYLCGRFLHGWWLG